MNTGLETVLWVIGAASAAASAFLLRRTFRPRSCTSPAGRAPAYREELLNSLYDDSPIAFAIADRQGKFQDMNLDPAAWFGYAKSELKGRSFSALVDEDSFAATRQILHRTLQGEKCAQDIRVRHKIGYAIDLNISTAPLIRRGKTIALIVFMQDVSERKRALERIRYQAYYDDMTGLPNRRSFAIRLEEKLGGLAASDPALAVCYLDVDRFKLINASFGRDFGDMLLLQIAARLARWNPEPGELARMEGDGFAAVLGGVGGEAGLGARLRELRTSFEEPFELNGVPVLVTVSVGAVLCAGSPESPSPEELLKRAYTALHRVKESGRSEYLLHSPDMDPIVLHKFTLQHEMRQALSNGEFRLHYQPQYDLGTGRIVGMEALIRWQHPERGLVSPALFIPAAEESGLIVAIGDWVIEEACRQNKAWQSAGSPAIPVSVNLSFRQFTHPNLTAGIAEILRKTGLDAQFLELEITESMTMDVEAASDSLKELASLGISISIDDFGTGYSSFHYLKSLPINRLKIDRSFVRDIHQDPNDAAIIAAIIAMAHILQLQVIAEGVETAQQVDFLREHSCNEMQGFFGSPPLPGERALSLLLDKRAGFALPERTGAAVAP